jgi:GTPase SAR1 family protein
MSKPVINPAGSSSPNPRCHQTTVIISIVGEDSVGKSSLFKSLFNLQSGRMSNIHLYSDKEKNPSPTVYDWFKLGRFNYALDDNLVTQYGLESNNMLVEMRWTGGLDSNIADRLRPKSYSNVHSIMACFSLINRESFTALSDRWLKEFDKYCAVVPRVLIGTKSDIINDPDRYKEFSANSISNEEAHSIVGDIGATGYIATSANNCVGIEEAFAEAIKAALVYQSVNGIGVQHETVAKACCSIQ